VSREPDIEQRLGPALSRVLSDAVRTGLDTFTEAQQGTGSVGRAQRLVELADRVLAESVIAARRDGTSWDAIGSALGVTRSAAHSRFAQLVNEREGTDVSPKRAWADAFALAGDSTRPGTTSVADLDDRLKEQLSDRLLEVLAETSDTGSRAAAAMVFGALNAERTELQLRSWARPGSDDRESADWAPILFHVTRTESGWQLGWPDFAADVDPTELDRSIDLNTRLLARIELADAGELFVDQLNLLLHRLARTRQESDLIAIRVLADRARSNGRLDTAMLVRVDSLLATALAIGSSAGWRAEAALLFHEAGELAPSDELKARLHLNWLAVGLVLGRHSQLLVLDELRHVRYGNNLTELTLAMEDLRGAVLRESDIRAAERVLRWVLEGRRRLGVRHPDALRAANNLAEVLLERYRRDREPALLDEIRELTSAAIGKT
jgi:hypothetical protein